MVLWKGKRHAWWLRGTLRLRALTFTKLSLVVKFVTVRTLLALATVYGWYLTQLEVNDVLFAW